MKGNVNRSGSNGTQHSNLTYGSRTSRPSALATKERTGLASALRRLQETQTQSSIARSSPSRSSLSPSRKRPSHPKDHIAFGSTLPPKPRTITPTPTTRHRPTSVQRMHHSHHTDDGIGFTGGGLVVPDTVIGETAAAKNLVQRHHGVNIAFRIIQRQNDGDQKGGSSAENPFVTHSPVEQCLVYGDKNVYADALFPSSATTDQVGNALVPPVLHSAMSGLPCVVAAYGGAYTGKSQTMFGEGGVFPSYVMQLLHELERLGLSQLWAVRCSVVQVVGDVLYDTLASDCDEDGQRSATIVPPQVHVPSKGSVGGSHQWASSIQSVVIEDLDSLQQVADQLPILHHPHQHQTNGTEEQCSHVVVSVRVEPALHQEGIGRHLMRPLGTVQFVECCDKIGECATQRTAHMVKKGGASFLNVISALLRRICPEPVAPASSSDADSRHSVRMSEYVPYNDSPLTSYLQPELDVGKVWVLLHVDNAQAPSDACRSTVDIGMRLSREKFPNGLPDPDYKVIAHREYQRGQRLNSQHQAEREEWAIERGELAHELHQVQEAYDACLTRTEELMAAENQRSGNMRPTSGVGVTNDDEKISTQLSQLQDQVRALQERNTSLAQENVALKSYLDNKETERELPRHQSASSNAQLDLVDSEDLKIALVDLRALVTKLQHHALCDASVPMSSYPSPSRDGSTGSMEVSTAEAAQVCLLQLTHQLCEREKAIMTLCKSVSGGSGTPEKLQQSGGKSVPDLGRGASCLHWQSWRRCLADLHSSVQQLGTTKLVQEYSGKAGTDPMRLVTKPPHRTSFESCVFCLYSTSYDTMSTGFHSYWTLPEPFPVAPSLKTANHTTHPSPNKVGTAGRPAHHRVGFGSSIPPVSPHLEESLSPSSHTQPSLSRQLHHYHDAAVGVQNREPESPPSRFEHLLQGNY